MKRYAEAPGAGLATSPLADMKWLPGLEGSERQAALEHNAQIAARTMPPWAHRTCEPRPSGGQSQIIRSSGSEQDSVGTRDYGKKLLCADVAKRTVEERMKNPNMPKRERFRWRWSKEPFVIAELEPMTWIGKRDRDEEPGPAQERERVPKRRKEDTRVAKLKWVGNALFLISGSTIVVLGRGI